MKTDRNLSIDRLLRRWVRSRPGPIGPGFTGGSKRTRPTISGCPDTEALAALADDGLPAAERQMVEAHVADCQRCQALTAAMVRTTIPPGAGAEKGVGSLFGGYILKRLPTPFSRRPTLNWLVPAAAAATAVALWVAVPGQRSPVTEERQIELQTSATPPPAPADVDLFGSTSGGGPGGGDNQARPNEAGASRDSTASADTRPAAPPESSLKDENRLSRQEGVASEQVTVTTGPELERSRRLDQAAPLAARAAAPAAAFFEVVSPEPLVRWRVGPGVAVQYSDDGGATWIAQETGASVPLTAGSSPSPAVCWLVGRDGIVVRSADGGRQWQRVAFPEAADLVAVRASNAQTATVDLADGRRLGTTDGGQTWAPVQK